MKHCYCANIDEITIRPLIPDDIEIVRCWRNDPNNTKFLTNIGYITRESQKEWYNSYLNDDNNYTFAIIDNSVVKGIVGTVSIYNIENSQADVGKIMIGDNRAHGRKIGRKAMVLSMMIGFANLNIDIFHALVEPDNIAAYKTYLAIGFKIENEHLTTDGKREYSIVNTEKNINEAGYKRENINFFKYDNL